MSNEDFITYEFIYNIARDKGPVSMKGIAEILNKEHDVSLDDFKLSVHCKVGGILSSLSQNKLITCLYDRDQSYYKKWIVSRSAGALPPTPYEYFAPKLKISHNLKDKSLMKSLLSHVEHARHMRWHMQILNDYAAVTCGTCEIQHIVYVRARARACNSVSSFRNILIILKSACSTCDKGEIIDVSHVPLACSTPFHVCQAKG